LVQRPVVELPAWFHRGLVTLRPHHYGAISDMWHAFAERRVSPGWAAQSKARSIVHHHDWSYSLGRPARL